MCLKGKWLKKGKNWWKTKKNESNIFIGDKKSIFGEKRFPALAFNSKFLKKAVNFKIIVKKFMKIEKNMKKIWKKPNFVRLHINNSVVSGNSTFLNDLMLLSIKFLSWKSKLKILGTKMWIIIPIVEILSIRPKKVWFCDQNLLFGVKICFWHQNYASWDQFLFSGIRIMFLGIKVMFVRI